VNPWDVFSWVCSAALAASAVLIFGFFLRDARGILRRDRSPSDEESERTDDQ
jgi:hypothetical protein